MTSKEAFHFGFLLRCAEEGLTEEETDARLEKAAAGVDTAVSLGSAGLDFLKNVLGTGARMSVMGLPIAGGLSYGAGHLAGSFAAQGLDPGYTPDEINRRELIATYADLTDALENRARRKRELAR